MLNESSVWILEMDGWTKSEWLNYEVYRLDGALSNAHKRMNVAFWKHKGSNVIDEKVTADTTVRKQNDEVCWEMCVH